MVPITKNICVVDEQGNEYEATYPKRAKGLVKQGRARFIDESTLCIACPPNILNLEDKNMSDIKDPRSNGPRPLTSVELIDKDSLDRVLNSIEGLVSNTHYVTEALNCVKDIEENEWQDEWQEHKTNAMLEIIRAREETNKEALRVLEKLVVHLTDSNK